MRVDGQVGRTRPQDREHADDQVDRAVEIQPDHVPPAHAERAQRLGQPCRAVPQRGIAQLATGGGLAHRNGLRLPIHPRGHEIVYDGQRLPLSLGPARAAGTCGRVRARLC